MMEKKKKAIIYWEGDRNAHSLENLKGAA